MPLRAYVFDAYGTLFDVQPRSRRHRDAAGPEADRFSEIWRVKQLEYAWMLSAAGRYADFWTLTERALDLLRAFPLGRRVAAAGPARRLLRARRLPDATRRSAR